MRIDVLSREWSEGSPAHALREQLLAAGHEVLASRPAIRPAWDADLLLVLSPRLWRVVLGRARRIGALGRIAYLDTGGQLPSGHGGRLISARGAPSSGWSDVQPLSALPSPSPSPSPEPAPAPPVRSPCSGGPRVLLLTSPAVFIEGRRAVVELQRRSRRLDFIARIRDDDEGAEDALTAALASKPDLCLCWNSRLAVAHLERIRAVCPVAVVAASWAAFVQRLYPVGVRELVDHWVAVCDGSAREILAGGIPAERVSVVTNGTDLQTQRPGLGTERDEARDRLGLPREAPVFAFLGRAGSAKNLGALIKAFAEVRQVLPDARLLLAGVAMAEGDKSAFGRHTQSALGSLRNALDASGVSDATTMTGPLEDGRSAMLAADVFCMTSRTEGLPLALLEALACGAPAVVSDVGGMADVVAPEAGLVIRGTPTDKGWPSLFAAGMLDVYARRHQLDPRGVAGRYSIGSTVAGYEELLSRLSGVPLPADPPAPAVPVWSSCGGLGWGAWDRHMGQVIPIRAVTSREAKALAAAGWRILTHGWRKEAAALARQHPEALAAAWHSGWTGTELMGEGGPLVSALQDAEAGLVRLLWNDERDVLPPHAAGWIWPCWSPDACRRPPTPKIPGAVAIGPHASTYAAHCKGILPGVVAAVAAGAVEIHVSAETLDRSKSTRTSHGAVSRGAAVRELYGDRLVEHPRVTPEEFSALLGSVQVVIHASLTDTWGFVAQEAVYAGTPCILSEAIPWARHLSAWARERCVCGAANDTLRMASLIRGVLEDDAVRDRLLSEQRAILDCLGPLHTERTRDSLRSLGFEV